MATETTTTEVLDPPEPEFDTADPIAINVQEMTGNVTRRAAGVPRDATIGELVESLSVALGLPPVDAQSRPVLYGARTIDGDVLNPSDRVGDVLHQDDTIVFTKSVTAG